MNFFILFGVILWICIIAALSLCLVALLIAAGVKKSWKFALRSFAGMAGAMLLVTGIFFGISYLLFRPYDPTSEADLKEAYKADFDTSPPVGITVLKSRQVVVGDSGAQWLLLKATPEEIDRHIAMGFIKADYALNDFSSQPRPNAPEWWQPPTARLELYENNKWSKSGGWSSSLAAIGVDRSSNMIWFKTSKSD